MPVKNLDPAFWDGRRVLVTGHTGFKGAWTALWLQRLGARVFGVALPACKDSLFSMLGLQGQIDSRVADLRDADAVAAAVAAAQPELVLHLTGQPSVRRSLVDPAESFAINVLGTVHLLNALRAVPGLRSVVVVTTDKVYADEEDGQVHREQDRLGGRDPYSASKAACELATAAMAQSFLTQQGVAVATARAGNVVGGGDFAPGRLVPDIVNAAFSRETLTLRNPDASRPWQHVLDCISGYLTYLAALTQEPGLPRAMNFGPRAARGLTVGEIATAMAEALGVPDRRAYTPSLQGHETHALALDSSLARRSLGWSDRLAGHQMIAATAAWYSAWARGADMRAVTVQQISEYEALP